MAWSSDVNFFSIAGTPFNAARALDAEPLLPTAAFTCISRTSQYPLGSAQAGTGERLARAMSGLAFFSVVVSTLRFPAVLATLTARKVATRPVPRPCSHVWYC